MKASTKNPHVILFIAFILLLPALQLIAQKMRRYEGNYPKSAQRIAREFSGLSSLKAILHKSQKKLSTDLLQLIHPEFLPKANSLEAHASQMKRLNQFKAADMGKNQEERIGQGMVYVYVYLNSSSSTGAINGYAFEVTDRDEKNNLAVAWVKVNDLEKLAALEEVRAIRSVMPPIVRTGSATTQGDSIHQCDSVRTVYSQAGAGMNVGIISDGVDHRAAAQATSDLPADGSGLAVRSNAVGGDEGTAMLEIVHDMVPGAGLFFHDSGNNVAAFNSAIDDLISAGCNVVCDDIGWLLQPFYEDGTVASHVASVLSANDIIYVSAAGNAADAHYQGDFFPLSGSPTVHDFSAGQSGLSDLYVHLPLNGSVIAVLQWNDQFGASGNDYDMGLYSYDASGFVQVSTLVQNGNDDPLEFISYTAPSSGATNDYFLSVQLFSGVVKNLEVYIYTSGGGAFNYSNNIKPDDSIFGHPAVVGAIGVGAIPANDVGNDTIEDFSSQGPVTISYPASVVRNKPDVCGIDGVSVTGAGGFSNPFYGTSAAAPHVAAIAAQMWAQIPDSTGNQVRDKLLASAVDIGVAGADSVFGEGRADALKVFQDNISLANIKVYLEGPYDSTTNSMTTAINGNIPLSQPYSGAPWNYAGNESVLVIPIDVVDWVLVDLRTGTAANTKVVSRAGFIKNDGSIVDLDGTNLLSMPKGENDYYMVVHHRNHLSVMSAAAEALMGLSNPYDFTTGTSQFFGGDAALLETGAYGMYGGDGESDGDTDASDINLVWRPQNGTGWQYTKFGDYDMDGDIDASDINLVWRPNNGKGTQVPQ